MIGVIASCYQDLRKVKFNLMLCILYDVPLILHELDLNITWTQNDSMQNLMQKPLIGTQCTLWQ